MTAAHPAYLEFIDFRSAGTAPEQIVAFLLRIERILRVAKAHAERILARAS